MHANRPTIFSTSATSATVPGGSRAGATGGLIPFYLHGLLTGAAIAALLMALGAG